MGDHNPSGGGRRLRPPVLILCGGRGTRLREKTEVLPKPLLEVGGRPLLWHVISIYARQGFTRFYLLTGYLGELIEEFVASSDWPPGISVETFDTGEETPTGGRVYLARGLVAGGTFGLTYSDGLADVDLDALLAFHEDGDALATMTVIRPNLQWGVVEMGEGGRVEGFREKPRSDHWVNGGFFFMEPDALAWIGSDSVLEREPIEDLAAAGELRAWRHYGFWDCVDTYKDLISMNDLWQSGEAKWLAPS